MTNKQKTVIIFVIFAILVSIQVHFTWMYFDDYGYASLSYLGKYTGTTGMNAGIKDVISFLIYHYNHWGGRVLWFFIEIVLLKIGIHAFRIVEVLFIVGIFYMIYKIICKIHKKDDWRIALITVICFGLIDIMLLRDAFYWYTASVLYLFPLLPILILVYLKMDKNQTTTKNIICIFLAFISAWSQEQISIFIVVYLALTFANKCFIEKKFDKWDILILVSSIIGFTILMLAPGSKARMDFDSTFYSLSLIDKIFKNVPLIIGTNFSNFTRMFSLIFFASNTYILIKNRNRFQHKWLIDTGIINSLFMLLITIIKVEGYFNVLYSINYFPKIIIIVSIIQLIYAILLEVVCLYMNKEKLLAFLLLAGSTSQAAMLMAPYFPIRSTVMFEITIFIIAIYLVTKIDNKKVKIMNYFLISVAIISIYNYSKITLGYYRNYVIKVENDRVLKKASKSIKQGEKIQSIYLQESKNILYGVYEPETGYGLIKSYYQIPIDVEIKYDKKAMINKE